MENIKIELVPRNFNGKAISQGEVSDTESDVIGCLAKYTNATSFPLTHTQTHSGIDRT